MSATLINVAPSHSSTSSSIHHHHASAPSRVVSSSPRASAPSIAPARRSASINVSDESLHLHVIAILGCVLHQLVSFESSQFPSGRGPITLFHTAYVPSISIGAYLRRVALYTKVSTEVLLQAVLHLHQLMQRAHAPMIVSALNIHRLLLTSLLTTSKFFDDAHTNNAYFAYVGGVPLKELNALEVEFLSIINFDFYVAPDVYKFFYRMCTERGIHQAGCACGPMLAHMPDEIEVDEHLPADAPDDIDFSICRDEDDVTYEEEAAACLPPPIYVDAYDPHHSSSSRRSESSVSRISVASTTRIDSSSEIDSAPASATPPARDTSSASPLARMDQMSDEIDSIRRASDAESRAEALMCPTPEAPYIITKNATGVVARTFKPTAAFAAHRSSPSSFLSASVSASVGVGAGLVESPISTSALSYSESYVSTAAASRARACIGSHSPASVALSVSHADPSMLGRYGVIEEGGDDDHDEHDGLEAEEADENDISTTRRTAWHGNGATATGTGSKTVLQWRVDPPTPVWPTMHDDDDDTTDPLHKESHDLHLRHSHPEEEQEIRLAWH